MSSKAPQNYTEWLEPYTQQRNSQALMVKAAFKAGQESNESEGYKNGFKEGLAQGLEKCLDLRTLAWKFVNDTGPCQCGNGNCAVCAFTAVLEKLED